MKHETISVTEFKAKCLALFDQIDQDGGTLTVTKRGRPLATVSRAKRKPFKSSEGALIGRVKIVGDLDKIDNADLWDVVRNPNELEEILAPKKKR
jgi:antitoxin (DNA-binding transcriptional repressor) of toxin-antitoxin stability system